MLIPNDGGTYTRTALLTRQGDDLVAGGYPQTVRVGSSHEFLVQVTNQDGQVTRYTEVTAIDRVDTDGEVVGAGTVAEREKPGCCHLTVSRGGTARIRSTVTPHLVGDSLRLSCYVYRGDPPATPSSASAYRHLQHWITVTPEA